MCIYLPPIPIDFGADVMWHVNHVYIRDAIEFKSAIFSALCQYGNYSAAKFEN